MSQRPYNVLMPRSSIAFMVAARAGSLGSMGSTSTLAWFASQWKCDNAFAAIAHTEALFHGPSNVYAAPYSAVVT